MPCKYTLDTQEDLSRVSIAQSMLGFVLVCTNSSDLKHLFVSIIIEWHRKILSFIYRGSKSSYSLSVSFVLANTYKKRIK